MQDNTQDVTKAGSADEASAAADEKLDDIYTYSSAGINDVKHDATGENARADIGRVTSGDTGEGDRHAKDSYFEGGERKQNGRNCV